MAATQLIRKLHVEGAKRFEPARLHVILHDMAECKHKVGSLTECSEAQLLDLLASVRAHPLRKPKPRRRSGRRERDGVVKMATPRQRDMINTLASELAWPQGMLDRFVKRFWGYDSVAEIPTSGIAFQVIKRLKTIKDDKRSRRPGSGSFLRTRTKGA